ncbi:uncharacterized protein LOC114527179 [Dendronephthya gigantea]|uniref:uncharacterized protein LOC114527179 n=1 Tax=Dendronephthya gigantea TaxID=151771 RepID=UPI00106B0640|nr:uncharacterized protein LOC114527179 [Dendronephthya gigantea]
MFTYRNASSSRSNSGKPSLIGMIRARKLAIKIKRRAQFLVADRRRREKTGKAILIHHDIPGSCRLLGLNTGLNDEGFLSSSDGRLLVSSRQNLTHSSRDIEHKKGPVREYKMTPDHFFPMMAIETKINEILESRLKGKSYDPANGKEISKELAEEIKMEVQRSYELKRYKLICIVNVGEMKSSFLGSARFGSRCLWNTLYDNFASSCYQNSELFAVATLYALYYD